MKKNYKLLQFSDIKKHGNPLFFISILFALFLTSIQSYSQCNTGIQINGTAYTPNYSGNQEIITLFEEPNGRYVNVNVLANRQYTFYVYEAGNPFSSYVDYITVTNLAGNYLGFGPSPLMVESFDYTGPVKVYYHSNAACQTNNIDKVIRMTSSTTRCVFPTNLNETNVASTSATLNWEEQNPLPSNGYQYFIATGNILPPSNDANSAVTGFTLNTSVTLNNLSPNQTYRWWVRSNCGSTFSVWAEGGSFQTTSVVCNAPTGLIVSNVTANSALFSWQAPNPIPSNGYNFAVNLTGATPIVADTFYPSATSQFVSNLASNTTYYYFVRSSCFLGNITSPWVFGGSFTTPIGFNCNAAIYGLKPSATYTPICTGSPETIASDARAGEYANVAIQSNKEYTFASAISTDYITITNESGSMLYVTGITPLVWQSGSNSGIVRYFLHANSSCGNNSTNRSRTISCAPSAGCLPPSNLTSYNVGSNVASISWTASVSNPTGGYDVYFSPSNTAPTAGTTPNGNINATAATINNLSTATTYYFWVRSNCDGIAGAWVSGGSFTTTALTCNAPSNIIKSNITSTSAQISWTAASPTPSNGYQLYYSTVNNAPVNTTTPTATSTTISTTISSLTSAMTYYIWVRSNCGGSQSAWILGGNFMTLTATCNPPTAPASSDITANSAQIDWLAAMPSPTQYDVYLATSSTTPNAATTPIGSIPGTSGTLNDLIAGTTYYFWVRSNCGSTQSAWISGGSFTTTVVGECTDAPYGQYPPETYTPICTGTAETIVNNAYAGEYSLVNVVANKQYTFLSSIATDHITITNQAGTVVYTSGTTPVVWQSGAVSGVIRYYFHTNSSCGTQNVDRAKAMICAAPTTTCTPPTTITASNITNSQVTLQWSAVFPAPQAYQFYYNTTNVAPTNLTAANGSALSTTRIVTGLTGSTTYYLWGRCFCGPDASDWISGGSFTTLPDGNCTTAVHGLLPSTTFSPNCNGVNQQITAIAWASEYANVAITSNKEYTFTSSKPTDYITITNAAGTTIYASGITPLIWESGANSGVIRYYLHANIGCGEESVSRIKSIKCTPALAVTENQIEGLQVFPNPTSSLLNIANTAEIKKIEITNIDGQHMQQQTINSTDAVIDMSSYTAGIYLVKVFVGNSSQTFKIIKN